MTDDPIERLQNVHRLRQKERAFFGQATASATHEINNVLAIINEYAGLLGDLVAGAEAGRPLDPARLAKTAASIQRQIKRGEGIVKRLNRFAHNADQAERRVELNALCDDAVGLAERLADMKRVKLEREAPPETLSADTDPFALTHAIFTAIMQALEAAADGGAITVALRAAEGGPCIDVVGSAEPGAALESLQLLMGALGGEARPRAEAGAPGVTLRIPIHS